MTKNVGGVEMAHPFGGRDRVAGVGFPACGYRDLAIVAYVVGAIALITGVVRFCPAWSMFGINTCSTAHK